MDDVKDEYREDDSVVHYVIDTVLLPLRIATSPLLLRTYLRTALLFITSTLLFGLAVVAYSSFYYAYIPVRGITIPVYLQFDHGASLSSHDAAESILGASNGVGRTAKWPYGITNVQGLVDRQKYHVVVEMEVPRSDTNLKAGNWMVGLEMRGLGSGSGGRGGGVKGLLGWDEDGDEDIHGTTNDKPTVLARSRRPALLTYRSPTIELAHRLLRLPFYLLGWHTESEHIEVSMLESVIFEAGYRNVPSSLRLELRSKYPLEVYRTSVRISAKLEGLRWLMYRYRLTSAIIGTGLFWSTEMGVLLFTWGIFTLLFGGKSSTSEDPNGTQKIKSEGKHMAPKLESRDSEPGTPFSDTSRTFPTLSSHQPLSYTSSKEERHTPASEDIPSREDAEADDEDDDFVMEEALPRPPEREATFTDSGIGTSLENSVERGLARRRSGRIKEEGE